MKRINKLRTTLLSLLPVGALLFAPGAMAQGVCNDMNFTDVTASAGINHTYVWPPTANASTPGGATAADVNGDGWIDLYAVQGDEGPNLLYINNGDGTFSEEAAARGAQLTGLYGSAASAADFDNDGDIDLGVSVYFGNSRVLINDGSGNFTSEIVLPVPFDERTFSSSWGDVDNDGFLELAIGMWVGRNGSHNVQGLHLYKNNAGSLQDYEFRTVPRNDSHIFAPRFADLNGDRLQDMHVVADYDETRVYMNIGGGMFDADWGFGGLNDMGHAIADYDKDGDLDIFTTDIETNNGNTLWKNDGLGNFTNVSLAAGIQDGGWAWAGSFGDLDLDADLDIYHVNGFAGDGGMWQDNPSLLFMNNDDGTFTEVAACANAEAAIGSMGRGMNFFDYDNDGDLDIFIVNNRYLPLGQPGQEGIPVLLRNDTPRNGRHWLKVTLDGTPPMHRDGIGSRVYVQTGSTTQMHEMHASTNYVSQDTGHIAHFGLDTAITADEVRAEWVTGDAVVVTNVAGDQHISIPSPTATVSTRTPAIGQNVTANANESNPVEWVIGGTTYADPVTTSFGTGGAKELNLLVYNTAMTQVLRTEIIRVNVAGAAGEPDIISPANGSVLPAGDVTFSWNDNGANVDDWQLLVGTSVGDNGLYDSGVLTASTSSAIVTGLPSDGSTLHVTLRWTDGGSASEKYYTYIASAGGGSGGTPAMLAPLDGATLAGSSETFVWSAEGANVDRWRIEISAVAHGSTDIYGQSFSSAVTSQLVSGLPTDGSIVYVRLKWRIDGVVTDLDLTYTAAGDDPPPPGSPEMTSPTPGSVLPAGDVSFAWDGNGTTVDDWQLLVGTSVSDGSLYDSGVLASTTTSAVVSGLPEDGSTIHVTLRWNESGVPSEANYTYIASSGATSGVPMIVSPADGSVLSGSSETFSWSAEGANVGRWRLEIGSTPGGTDLLVRGLTSDVLSTVVDGLPTDGSTIYVRLEWRISGVVTGADYVYTASGGGPPPPGVPAVNSPTPGSTLPLGDVTFAWGDNGATVDDWQLLVGTSVGDNSLFDSGVLPVATTSAVVSGLPEDGSTIHVTLRWNEAGVPSEVNYTYTASSGAGAGVPTMLSPVDGSVLAGATQTFTWSAEGTAVDRWRLEIGTVPDASDIYGRSHAASVTSLDISGLPTDGSVVYVKLKWRIDGVVYEANYVYTAALQ